MAADTKIFDDKIVEKEAELVVAQAAVDADTFRMEQLAAQEKINALSLKQEQKASIEKKKERYVEAVAQRDALIIEITALENEFK